MRGDSRFLMPSLGVPSGPGVAAAAHKSALSAANDVIGAHCRAGENDTPQAVFERHHLKGAKEQGVSDVLSGLDLHHPPCLDLIANQAFYAIGMLAHSLLVSVKVLDLPDDAQSWRMPTIIRHLLTVPVSVSRHARYEVARICVPAGWLRWWRLFVDKWLPKRKVGRPALEVVDSG